jgi:hypothetical protein
VSSVRGGADTVQAITARIGWKNDNEKASLNTNINGCLGRMSELGLFEKSIEGLSTRYGISKFVKEVLPDVQ